MDQKAEQFLLSAQQKRGMSVRGYHTTIQVAKTIAQLENENTVKVEHIGEALQYRPEIHLFNILKVPRQILLCYF